jgi:dihydroorotate dehydrogenase
MKGKKPKGLVLGVNVGINKDTPLEQAAKDYQRLMVAFNPVANYIAINISSPNTPGLRGLQSADALEELLTAIKTFRKKPLLIKLAPDLSEQQLDEALDVLIRHGVEGVIATNTTITRPNLRSRNAGEAGGLSGAPLSAIARKGIGHIYTHTKGKLPIVAVGGIMSRQDADAAINAGASLVQIFTGLIYRGPGLVKEILKAE